MNFKHLFGLTCGFGLLAATSAFAALPKSSELVAKMGMGYNIGNTMEVPENPTNWGNQLPTAAYIKAIKTAGFNTVRIPCAWYSHSDALAKDIAANGGTADKDNYTHVGKASDFTNPTIDAAWLKQVKDVVDMIIAEGMYVVLNSHWDEGWLEDRVYNGNLTPRNADITIANSSATTEARQKAYWSQIATYFKDYDEHLLFAGANEPGVNDPWLSTGQVVFDDTRMQILKGYYTAFISAVRTAGGNNDTRTLIVQAPRTEMENAGMLSSNWPTDPSGAGYMMAEVHYYPYQYSLMTADENWGKQFYYYSGLESTTDAAHNMGAATNAGVLGTPAQISKAFGELKTMFCDKGIPVIIGELGAIKRTGQITGDNLKLHLQGRALFYGEVAKNAKANGIIPYVWDTGAENDGNMTIITRQQGVYNILDPDVLNAMRKVYVASGTDIPSNLDSLVNENPDVDPSAGTGVEVTYTSKTADSSEVGTLRINLTNANKDLSKYVGLEVRMKGAVASAGPAANGENEFGWASMDIFMMCGGGWTWFDANLMEQADVELSASEFKTFQVKFDTDFRTVPTAEDLKATNAIGINLYGPQVSGKVIFDYIAGVKADGSIEIIDGFEKKPSTESTASGKIVAIEGSTSIVKVAAFTRGLKAVSDYGMLKVSFVGSRAARGSVKLMNSMGQIVAQENFVVSQGVNSINLNTNYRGAGYLIVKNGGQVQSMKVMLK